MGEQETATIEAEEPAQIEAAVGRDLAEGCEPVTDAPRVLILSDDFGLNTGFARVCRELIKGFKARGYTIAQLAWFYYGNPGYADRDVHQTEWGCFRYPVTLESPFGASMLDSVIADFKPDVVLTVGDVWMTDYMPNAASRGKFYWLAYFPIDAEPFPPPWVPWLADVESCGKAVPYSEFACDMIRKQAPDYELEPVYFGVDCEIFHPLTPEERMEARKALGIAEDAFAVVTVDRNAPRKRYPMISELMAAVMEEDPNIHWHMHCDPFQDVGGDLRGVWRELGMVGPRSRHMTFSFASTQEGMSDPQLNAIYNLGDVTLKLAMEGYGLSTIESMAAGVPVLAAEGSANTELINKSGGGLLIPAAGREWIASAKGRWNLLMAHSLPNLDLARQLLLMLRTDPEWRLSLGRAARNWAVGHPWSRTQARICEMVEAGVVEMREKRRPLVQQLQPHEGADKLLEPSRLLVTETSGGIGDMVSLAAALKHLKRLTGCRITVECAGSPNGPRARLLRACEGVDEVIGEGQSPPPRDAVFNMNRACSDGEIAEYPDIRSSRAEIYMRALGIMPGEDLRAHIIIPEEIEAAAKARMDALGLQPGYVALATKSAEAYKDWPRHRWMELAQMLREHGLQVLAWDEEIQPAEVDILETAAMTALAGCTVSADTLMLHLAGALGVRAIGLYGPSSGPSRVRAYPMAVAIQAPNVCSPCWRNRNSKCYLLPKELARSRCMEDIATGTVFDAVMAVLGKAE